MAANINPIFSALSALNFTSLALGTTDASMNTGNAKLILTAAVNGSFVDRIIFTPRATPQTNEAVVGRVWVNNGLSTNTVGNNALLGEVNLVKTVPSVVAGNVVAANTQTILSVGFPIPATFTIWVSLSSTVLAGYDVVCVAGSY